MENRDKNKIETILLPKRDFQYITKRATEVTVVQGESIILPDHMVESCLNRNINRLSDRWLWIGLIGLIVGIASLFVGLIAYFNPEAIYLHIICTLFGLIEGPLIILFLIRMKKNSGSKSPELVVKDIMDDLKKSSKKSYLLEKDRSRD